MQTWSFGRRAAYGVSRAAWLGAGVGAMEHAVLAATWRGLPDAAGMALSGVFLIAANAAAAGSAAVVTALLHTVRRQQPAYRTIAAQVSLAVGALAALHTVPFVQDLLAQGRTGPAWAMVAMPVGFLGALHVNVRYWLARQEARQGVEVGLGTVIGGLCALVVGGSVAGAALAAPANGWALPEDVSVVWVTVDGLRDDVVGGADAAGRPLTPALDALSDRGVRFTTTLAPSPSPVASHASLLTGLHPLRAGVLRAPDVLPRGRPAVASAFADEGFRAGAFVSTLALSAAGLHRGFHVFDDARIPEAPLADRGVVVRAALAQLAPERAARREDGDTVAAALRWWGDLGDAPAFTWVHLAGPSTARTPDGVGDAAVEAGYATAVRAVDAWIGALLDAVEASPRAARTWVVVVGATGQPGPTGVDERGVRVPLIVAGPGVTDRGGAVAPLVRTYDLAPSALAWAKLSAEPRMEGLDLTGFLDGRRSRATQAVIVGQGDDGAWRLAVRQPGVKYVLEPGLDEEDLYDLDADPGETTDLAAEQPQAVDAARAALAPDREALRRWDDGGEADAFRRARLAAQGYR